MNQRDAFNGVLTSLNDAMLNDALWPSTSALIDEACGSRANGLYVADGAAEDAKVVFAKMYYRGQCHDEIVRDYLQFYHPRDERLPRLRRLPYNRLVHVTDLYYRAGVEDVSNLQRGAAPVRGAKLAECPARRAGWLSNYLGHF